MQKHVLEGSLHGSELKLAGSLHGAELKKALVLSLYMFLIVFAGTLVKPVSTALVLSELGSGSLPWIWALSAIGIGLYVAWYGYLTTKYKQKEVLLYTSLGLLGLLLFSRVALHWNAAWYGVSLYIWADLYTIIMVEQSWNIANGYYRMKSARRIYWCMATFQCGGGILAGLLASKAGQWGSFGDVAILSIFAITLQTGILYFSRNTFRVRVTREPISRILEGSMEKPAPAHSWVGLIFKNNHLLLMMVVVVLAQMVTYLIDFQFNALVERTYGDPVRIAQFMGKFFIWLSTLSLLVSLVVTKAVHWYLSPLMGLFILPLFNLLSLTAFILNPIPLLMYVLKLGDKALNQSLFRPSMQFLYIPMPDEMKYVGKAVLDMFGRKFCKLLCALVLIPVISYLPWECTYVISLLLLALLIMAIRKMDRTPLVAPKPESLIENFTPAVPGRD